MTDSATIDPTWAQGTTAPLTITALTNRGDGIGHLDGRAVFVPNTVPGDKILVRLVRVKPSHAFGTVRQILQNSPQRIRPTCIVADKCGGCQWQPVDYGAQLEAKEQFVRDAIVRIGHLDLPEIVPILPAPSPFRYRNKVTYPITSGTTSPLKVGYYRRGSHRLVNLNQCPVQDERLDAVLQRVKADLQATGWQPYNERTHRGKLRHLSLRIGRRTGQILLTLVSTTDKLPDLQNLATIWLDHIPQMAGICLNLNPKRTNAIFGSNTTCIAGRAEIQDQFAGLTLAIDSTSFFQVYAEQAERLLTWIVEQLDLQGNETLVDAYCGIGTFTLPLAQRVKQAIGIEVAPTAVRLARTNAQLNAIANVEFLEGTVESLLSTLPLADLVLLDPPRKGCDRRAIEALLYRPPQRIVYVSCNPATLARDLDLLVERGSYTLSCLRAADFFPQTSHVETVAFLTHS
ncbi:23S rRNA (uracil(1939)-C(5))-methyltransferase RlmD [Synechococcus sp. PCC 7336]|uniref:23S rRNA (uracil(1939)-C(5))-methyltransferase RlmD n=1 Tax=Synechococcus sp. PCC 7336 TaxID=195250 RepID=UPI00036BD461|nr:23S rRNA (uracil(1939)-C(5))-methyltransferase RlmD [Synechococcus sp. PCC 7336]